MDHSRQSGFRHTGSRIFGFEIHPTISRLLLVIIAIGVHHQLRSCCPLGSPSFIRLTRRSMNSGSKLKSHLSCSVLEAARCGSFTVDSGYRMTFTILFGIQSFANLFGVNGTTELRWRILLIVFDSGQQLNTTFRQNWNSLRHISTISCMVPMHEFDYLFQCLALLIAPDL
jgi:hypothetical protein